MYDFAAPWVRQEECFLCLCWGKRQAMKIVKQTLFKSPAISPTAFAPNSSHCSTGSIGSTVNRRVHLEHRESRAKSPFDPAMVCGDCARLAAGTALFTKLWRRLRLGRKNSMGAATAMI